MKANPEKTWRVIDLINWGSEYFKSRSITNARREIEWLLCHVLECRRIDLYLEFERPLFGRELSHFKSMVLRRVKGEPFQHIIGKAPFFGRDFNISPDALIPRPETEVLIDLLKEDPPKESILEVGTGSGCIAITISLEDICHHIIATDISKAALSVARANAMKHNIQDISFRHHDFLHDSIQAKFDVVVSNPPYVSAAEFDTLDLTVKNYDPVTALTDHEDGLTFYHRFSLLGRKLLKPMGYLLLEIGGVHQVDAIQSLFAADNYNVEFYPDLQQNSRVVKVTPEK